MKETQIAEGNRKSINIIGILGLILMSLLAVFYWETDVTIIGHIFFLTSILTVGMFTSYIQSKWSKVK